MFISKVYRPDRRWPWYTFLALEFPVAVACLALFGIADPNTYRTRLWQDGADNGFNSSPSLGVIAYANYEHYTVPGVWSSFITSFNVVISVLTTFIMIVKIPMFILHCFPPLLSAVVHGILVALFAVSIHYQAGSDMSDPDHPQPGAPWYITKSCSVAHHASNIQYCQQAKAAFACSIIALAIFAGQTIWSLWSLYPSAAARTAHALEKSSSPSSSASSYYSSNGKSAYAEAAALSPAPAPKTSQHRSFFPLRSTSNSSNHNTSSGLNRNPTWGKEAAGPHGGFTSPSPVQQQQQQQQQQAAQSTESPYAGLVPMTPRTKAFNRINPPSVSTSPSTTFTTTTPSPISVSRDLPLRNHFSSPNAPRSPTFGVKSPLSGTFAGAESTIGVRELASGSSRTPSPPEKQQQMYGNGNENGNENEGQRGRGRPMYFPPPPPGASAGGKKGGKK